MKSLLLILLPLLLAGCAHTLAPDTAAYHPQPGDLLFQDLDGSPLCDAIETVTHGYHRARLSHVGIVADTEGQAHVIEAGGKGVVLTPLGRFLARSHDAAGRPKVLVGRLKDDARRQIPAAIAFARQQLGKPYDRTYLLRDDAYYCSELVWDAFKQPGDAGHLFHPAPMNFKDPRTGQFPPAWVEYFARLSAPIPQGQPGVNPAAMSRSSEVEIVHVLGQVTCN